MMGDHYYILALLFEGEKVEPIYHVVRVIIQQLHSVLGYHASDSSAFFLTDGELRKL
jgi:hypothetical protein